MWNVESISINYHTIEYASRRESPIISSTIITSKKIQLKIYLFAKKENKNNELAPKEIPGLTVAPM